VWKAISGDLSLASVPMMSNVLVIRSPRRRRTVSASRQGDRIVVRVPARMPAREVDRWVATLVERVLTAERRARPSDAELLDRARQLSQLYLAGRAEPASVTWSDRQQHRWGSCTPADRSIRLSRRLTGTPGYVRDYVLLHELAHLLHGGHGPAFRALIADYPERIRAEAFLDGWSAGEDFRRMQKSD
jgi:predicted metal-dependent hydrolase